MSQIWNHVALAEEVATPVVGAGATMLLYTDRHAYTITSVAKSGKSFTMQRDNAKRVDNNGLSESQVYEITPDTNGPVTKVRMTKKGWRVGGMRGNKVLVGCRDEYYDFSF